ncbi:MAG: hypothetical protein H7249_15425 [Chitinophagaceae bacterium]|nr:hypothetical protein [Oligoflexus sp.]
MIDTLRLILMLCAGLQALMMFIDEGIFHHRRGLERFERWGHVADTSLFCAAVCVPAFFEPSRIAVIVFIILAFASSLLITKDEWIHAEACSPIEQWCHSLLFILHGALLVIIGVVWVLDPTIWELKALPLGVFLWGVYQHLYWNVYYVRSSH